MPVKPQLPKSREVTPSRRIAHLLVALLLGALTTPALTTAASASFLVIAWYESPMNLTLGALPRIEIMARTDAEFSVTLGNLFECCPTVFVGHWIGITGPVWSTVNFGPGTSLFTGVPLISNLLVTVDHESGFLQDGHTIASNQLGGGGSVGPHFGGELRLSGQMVIYSLAGNIKLPVPLDHVGGQMGETTMVTLIGNNITVTGGPFITDSLTITGVTSNIVTIPARANVQGVGFTLKPTPEETVMTLSTNGGFVSVSGGLPLESHTVTIVGTNTLVSATRVGRVTVVAPFRVATGAITGNIPGAVSITARFAFVPEPSTTLLLVSGALGLSVMGRRRVRKKARKQA